MRIKKGGYPALKFQKTAAFSTLVKTAPLLIKTVSLLRQQLSNDSNVKEHQNNGIKNLCL